MLSRGYLSFHKTVSFYKSNGSKSVLLQKRIDCRDSSGITKIKQIFHRNFQNICNIKSLFREIDVFPFGASILLICVRLRFVASASLPV